MNGEVIAVFLSEGEPRSDSAATALVRGADGEMSLQDIHLDSPMARRAMRTGCFRRGKPIIDPVSRQMIGYEMEPVASTFASSL
jgi:hypothetical protein